MKFYIVSGWHDLSSFAWNCLELPNEENCLEDRKILKLNYSKTKREVKLKARKLNAMASGVKLRYYSYYIEMNPGHDRDMNWLELDLKINLS